MPIVREEVGRLVKEEGLSIPKTAKTLHISRVMVNIHLREYELDEFEKKLNEREERIERERIELERLKKQFALDKKTLPELPGKISVLEKTKADLEQEIADIKGIKSLIKVKKRLENKISMLKIKKEELEGRTSDLFIKEAESKLKNI